MWIDHGEMLSEDQRGSGTEAITLIGTDIIRFVPLPLPLLLLMVLYTDITRYNVV